MSLNPCFFFLRGLFLTFCSNNMKFSTQVSDLRFSLFINELDKMFTFLSSSSTSSTSSSSSWHTPKIATEDKAIGKSSVAKYSGYHHNHHHHVEDYDYVEDIDKDGYDFDDTVNDLM